MMWKYIILEKLLLKIKKKCNILQNNCFCLNGYYKKSNGYYKSLVYSLCFGIILVGKEKENGNSCKSNCRIFR